MPWLSLWSGLSVRILTHPPNALKSNQSVCLACLALGLPVAKAAADAQVPWLEAIEDRLSSTAKALGAIRGIKMTGLSESVSDKILDLRQIEIRASLRHRLLNICLMGISK